MMITTILLYTFIVGTVTSAHFQGHMRVKKMKTVVTVLNVSHLSIALLLLLLFSFVLGFVPDVF